jgi:S-DNA-T family DNA segregation ATPase FtsK/SpoIIIE
MLVKKSDPSFSNTSALKGAETSFVAFELRRLLLISTTIALLMALVSYSPSDPSWSTWSTQLRLHNWMGRSGSIVADILLQLFGLSAFALALLPAIFALKMPFREQDDWRTRYAGPTMLILSTSCLLQAFLRTAWMPWRLPNPGGLIGELCFNAFHYLVGGVGTRLLAVVLLLSSLILIFRWRLSAHATFFVKRGLPRLRLFFAALVHDHLPALLTRLKSLKTKYFGPKKPSLLATPPAPQTVKAILAQTTSTAKAPKPEPEPAATADATSEFEVLPEVANAVVTEQAERTTVQKVPRTRVHRGRNKDYQLPHLSLISGKADSKVKPVDKNWYLEKANILVQKLKDFGVEGEVVHISPGPVITVYEFKPASGVKIKEISNLSDDLTLALSVMSVRIVAPIPGKPVVGIEIPSPHRETVYFKDMIQETPFFDGGIKIPIALGRMASGEPFTADLASMPHLLIAGSTGTGKSVFINTLICSLLYRFSPEQLKLILVDPKMVELSMYENVPHLLLPVVVDSKKAVLALRWAVDEMERRYTAMHQFGVRHIDSYNERLAELQKEGQELESVSLPYIVVVIDEYADLMAVVPKEVELSIARLAQKARASGIHLVLATQRPSTDVVTGTIKANFPSRISFRVASSIDSKTILDRTGADRLLGHGDMLFHSAGLASLRRMQGPFLSDQDLNRIVEYLKSQGEPEYDERILAQAEEVTSEGGLSAHGDDEEGRLYDMAVRIVTEKGEASISLIQRHLRIGYNRAASLMEQMEKEGVVGASTGPAKRRSVLVNS